MTDPVEEKEGREQWEGEKCRDTEGNRTEGREDPTKASAWPPGRLRGNLGSGNSFLSS